MNVPPASDPRWLELASGQLKAQLNFMATKILLTRITAIASFDPTTITSGARELHELFKRNMRAANVQRDLVAIFGAQYRMGPAIYDLDEVVQGLSEGRVFLLAGSESTLRKLPTGNWIGGTAPMICENKSEAKSELAEKERLFATEMPDFITSIDIKVYEDCESLRNLYNDAPHNGFSIIIIPASSSIHMSFALNAPTYPGFATRPVAGWISGVPLSEIDTASAKVFNGHTTTALNNAAIVMRVTLPEDKIAEVDVVNIFEPDSGDVITADKDGFEFQFLYVNGIRTDFPRYVRTHWSDHNLPLVANYHGIMVNSSFQKIDEHSGTAKFYAPLFKGIEYRLAKPVRDYERRFSLSLPTAKTNSTSFSFNCILNYRLLEELEIDSSTIFMGPITFGEIAFQLLNQTMVTVTITDFKPDQCKPSLETSP